MMEYAIVTPIWRVALSENEYFNVSITIKSNSVANHFFVYPDGLELKYYRTHFPLSQFISVPFNALSSITAYSQYLLRNDLYCTFEEYQGIVISQTDAIMLKPLPKICDSYDYIGAPWDPSFVMNKARVNGYRRIGWFLAQLHIGTSITVGNGGLSWRKVHTFMHIEERLAQHGLGGAAINEDLVLAYLGALGGLAIPGKDVASRIFLEKISSSAVCYAEACGFHALERYHPDIYEQLRTAALRQEID